MKQLRTSIIDNTFPEVVRSMIDRYFQKEQVPDWVVEALEAAKIQL
jgi:hypothetical protein